MKLTPLLYSSLHTVIKLFAIAFTCVYLHLTVGVVKTTHYCMGRESSSILYSFEAEPCICSRFLSNLEKNSCCDDASELIVLDEDQTVTPSLTLQNPDFFLIADLYVLIDQPLLNGTVTSAIFLPHFLPPPKEPLYKIHCNYTFYEDELVA